ncbi:MAG: DUF805 domain-containing protein [Gammaproteobacteria bacterium]
MVSKIFAEVFKNKERIGRVRFTAYAFIIELLTMGLWVVLLSLTLLNIGDLGLWLMIILFALTVILLFRVAIRRLHDLDMNGWISVGLLVPLVNILVLCILLFAPGKKSDNRFGPSPPPNRTIDYWGLGGYVLMLICYGVLYARFRG